MEGQADWVHWGLYTDTSLDRKTGVAPQISNFTLLGDSATYLAVYQYSDNLHGYTWFDGTPTAAVTNTTTGVWAYGYNPLGSGFEFTVPADTVERTLRVYVGKYNAQGKLTVSLSDGSVNTYSNITSGIGIGKANYVYTINYAAAFPSQTLTVRWTLATSAGQTPNVTLQSATLALPGGNNPPSAALTSPSNLSAFEAPAVIPLAATATDPDGEVAYIEFYEGTNQIGKDATSPYTFDWTNSVPGQYSLTASVVDTNGLSGRSMPLEVFVYGSGGTQSGNVQSAPSLVDLTTEGAADWTHWGLVDSNSVDRKAAIIPELGDAVILGATEPQQYGDNATAFSWTDGTPTPATNGTTTGIFLTGVTNGFALTAPADSTPRTLRVYVGGYGMQGLFEAWLSDFSARPYVDTSVSNVYASSYVLYTINYASAQAGQQLHIQYRPLTLFDAVYGNVTLASATLQQGAPSAQAARLFDPRAVNGSFLFSFLSQSNFTHTVEYTPALSSTNWQVLTNFPGTGQVVTITNQSPADDRRYYRVLTE